MYQLRITLAHVEPPVWRRVLMPGAVPLSLFHRYLKAVMGWRNMHLHRFIVAGRALGPAGHADQVGAQDLFTLAHAVELAGTTFQYDYDFGDDWQHRIEVEDVRSSPAATPTPVCVVGERACPPEDCGGPGGYAELLDALKDPGHQRHTELLDWLKMINGPKATFDPERFDLAATNRKLRRVAKEHRGTDELP